MWTLEKTFYFEVPLPDSTGSDAIRPWLPNWKIKIIVNRAELDSRGVVVSQEVIDEVVGKFLTKPINQVPPFDQGPITPEKVAVWLYRDMTSKLNAISARVTIEIEPTHVSKIKYCS